MIGQDAEQNKTNICVTQLPATVSAKQNQNISIRLNFGAGYSAGPLTCNLTRPKMCDGLHRTEIDGRTASGPPYLKICWAGHTAESGEPSACWQMFTVRSTEVFLGPNEVATDAAKNSEGAQRRAIKNSS